jgi:hypothetical protein
LDNTNFRGGSGYWGYSFPFGGAMRSSPIPVENDYDVIRQGIWWVTDRTYKSVVETLAKKKAFMESKTISDKPNDFARQEPTTHFEPQADLAINEGLLEKLAVTLSAIFKSHPDVQSSSVTVAGKAANNYLVNTEGTRLRAAEALYSVSIEATVQSEDGMKFSGSAAVYAPAPKDWPSAAEMNERCTELIEKLLAVKQAPTLESYSGPVLFDAEAAAALFLQHFGNKFTGGQRDVGGRTAADDFSKKLNRRILPRWMSVVDDPTQETIDGVTVTGHYTYDDQGVKARPVQLVEKGRLLAQVMSRNPSKEFDRSTGHGRGSYGVRSSVGCLIVGVDEGLDADALREELIEACQDEGLEYGIRVAALSSSGRSRFMPFGFDFDFDFGFGGRSGSTTPLVMYKVYPDGREEPVRGAEIAKIDIRDFKRMLAAGGRRYVLNKGGDVPRTVVAPAMLFEELDLAKIDRDFDKPPILESPLARQAAD